MQCEIFFFKKCLEFNDSCQYGHVLVAGLTNSMKFFTRNSNLMSLMYCSKDFGLNKDWRFLLEVDSEELLSTCETQGTLLSSLVLFVV